MAEIKGNKRLGLRVLNWHAGQFTPTYAVGSSFYAGKPIDETILREAISELRHLWGQRPEGNYDNRSLKSVIKSLESLL